MPSPAIQLEIDGALADFRWNEAELISLLTGSEIAQDLARRAIKVESAAKDFATGVDGGPNVRTGRLRGSITWTLGEDAESIYADVGTSVEYGVYLELGTIYMEPRPFLQPALLKVFGEDFASPD